MPPPAFGLRALPRVHQRDARGPRRMRAPTAPGQTRAPSGRVSFVGCVRGVGRDTLRMMNDPRAELPAAGLERFFGHLDVRATGSR